MVLGPPKRDRKLDYETVVLLHFYERGKQLDVFNKDELDLLLGKGLVGCVGVSILMPVHRVGSADALQDPIRLRNLLHQAEKRLVDSGLKHSQAAKITAPVEKLLDDGSFWRQASDGLAVFLSEDMSRVYRLPLEFRELVAVSDRFHVKSLLPVLTNDGKYYVLAISHKRTTLLQCTRYGLVELPVSDPPGSFPDFMRGEHFEKELQFYAHGSSSGVPNATFYSTGKEISDFEKTHLLRYCQRLDNVLRHDVFKEEAAPLVLAAVESLIPIYRQANKYHFLLDEPLLGSPEEISPKELRDRAWKLVQSRLDRTRLAAADRFRALWGTGVATNDLEQVVSQAYQGKVEVLFVPTDTERWGTFSAETGKVTLHDSREACDSDLLDMAASLTLAHRGEVYAVASNELPEKPLAAVLRQ